jgi:membrane fusion protein, multidrug efflux system
MNTLLPARNTKHKRNLATIALLSIVLATLAACGKGSADGGAGGGAPPAPPVSVATVIQKEVSDGDEFSGRFEATDFVEVRPRVAGYLTKVHFQAGSLVKKGDLLFTIDPRPYEADAAKAEADLKRAETSRELARAEVTRAEKLLEATAISKQEFDQRTATFKDQESAGKAARAALTSAKLNTEYAAIRAPISGRISRAEVTVGNLVTPGTTMLTTIASQDPIHVYFDIDEQQLLKYESLRKTGTDAVPGKNKNAIYLGLNSETDFPHQGRVDFIDNRLDARTGTIRGRAVFDNKDRLFTPGLFAKLKLAGTGTYNAVLITDRAIGTDQNKKFVLVVDKENKANYRAIKLGPLVDGLRVVKEGLQPGESIVVNGLQRVRPGIQVQPEKTAMLPVTGNAVASQEPKAEPKVDAKPESASATASGKSAAPASTSTAPAK